MLDAWMRGSTGIGAGTINDNQQDPNSNPVIEASGQGLSFTGIYPTLVGGGSDFTGRVSVGIIALAIVGMGLLYIATRPVQGGG